MSEPTGQDMDTAYRALWPLTRYRWPRDDEITDEQRGQVERVAAALAAEREKARAPFLVVIESLERAVAVEGISYERSTAYEIAARRIRQAAEATL